MKNTQKAFCIRSPIASRPFYVIQDGNNKLSWQKEPNYHISEPIDMERYLPTFEESRTEIFHKFPNTPVYNTKSRKLQNVLPSMNIIPNEIPILQLKTPIIPSLLCTPYFPFDLMNYGSTDDVAFDLYQNMLSKDKKTKRVTEDLQISTNPKRKITDLEEYVPAEKKQHFEKQDDPPESVPGSALLLKCIKKFILCENEDDYQFPNNIINLIGKSEELLVECIYQLIQLINSTKSTTGVIQSWKLMMLIVGYFPIPQKESENLKNFFTSAAGHNEVDTEIQFYAKVCLCRLFCKSRLNIPYDPNDTTYKYIKSSMSVTQIFGVSLAEIFVKEEYKRIRNLEYSSKTYQKIKKNVKQMKISSNNNLYLLNGIDEDNFNDSLNKIPESLYANNNKSSDENQVLVPVVLKNLIKQMLLSNVFETEGVFRISGSKSKIDDIVDSLNEGNWDLHDPKNMEIFTENGQVPLNSCIHVFSGITKKFFREMQEYIIPYDVAKTITLDMKPYQIIRIINQLPSQNKETLMYFVGFLQRLSQNKAALMNTHNLHICLSPNIIQAEEEIILNPEAINKSNEKKELIMSALIDYWNASPVYDL